MLTVRVTVKVRGAVGRTVNESGDQSAVGGRSVSNEVGRSLL